MGLEVSEGAEKGVPAPALSMSVCLSSVCLPVHLPHVRCDCLSVCLPVWLSTRAHTLGWHARVEFELCLTGPHVRWVFVCLSVCLVSVCLVSVCLSDYASTQLDGTCESTRESSLDFILLGRTCDGYLSVCLPACLPACLSACLSVRAMDICLHVCLSV